MTYLKDMSFLEKNTTILDLTKQTYFGKEDILFFTKKGDRNFKDWEL